MFNLEHSQSKHRLYHYWISIKHYSKQLLQRNRNNLIKTLCKSRVLVEQTFGQLKARFRKIVRKLETSCSFPKKNSSSRTYAAGVKKILTPVLLSLTKRTRKDLYSIVAASPKQKNTLIKYANLNLNLKTSQEQNKKTS